MLVPSARTTKFCTTFLAADWLLPSIEFLFLGIAISSWFGVIWGDIKRLDIDDKKGFIMLSNRHTCLMITILTLVLAIVSAAVFFYRRALQQLKCADLPSQMKMILLSLQIYAEYNGGFLPQYEGANGLNCLRSSGLLVDPRSFSVDECFPVAGAGKALHEDNVSFGYFAGASLNSPKNTIILIRKEKRWKPTGLVGYIDGRVLELSGEKWRKVRGRYSEGKGILPPHPHRLPR